MHFCQVKSDPVPAKLMEDTKDKPMVAVPLFDVEKYIEDDKEYNRIIKDDDKRETGWNGLQWSVFRLRVSRYKARGLQKDVPSYGEQESIQEIIKSFPSLFLDSDKSRDTLEKVGGVLAPQFNLELEF